MALNTILAVTSPGGPGASELELSRARSWDWGELAAGRAALPYISWCFLLFWKELVWLSRLACGEREAGPSLRGTQALVHTSPPT